MGHVFLNLNPNACVLPQHCAGNDCWLLSCTRRWLVTDCTHGKHEGHAPQDGVKGETLLRWLKRQGVIQLGAEWHRHLYDLPALPKRPSKATAAQRPMPPTQVSL